MVALEELNRAAAWVGHSPRPSGEAVKASGTGRAPIQLATVPAGTAGVAHFLDANPLRAPARNQLLGDPGDTVPVPRSYTVMMPSCRDRSPARA